MTRDHARKKAIRAQMAASGEPYNVAARRVDAAESASAPVGPPLAADEVIARVNNTLATPRARFEFRADWDYSRTGRRPPGLIGRLARRAAKPVTQALFHPAGEGFIEPAANRYQANFGPHARMEIDGEHYAGPGGSPVEARYRREDSSAGPLDLLKSLRDVTEGHPVGHETVRGVPCQAIAVQAGSVEATVWIDDEHVRRVRTEEAGSSESMSLSITTTLELWDFGTEDGPDDWSHLPTLAGFSPWTGSVRTNR